MSGTISSASRRWRSTMVSDPAESATSRLRGWLHAMLVHRRSSEVYQTSTMGALLDGVYDGDVTIRELLQHGDFGLGTFNGLDGEMLVLDGVCYQLRGDGSAQVADADQRTPFALALSPSSTGLIRRSPRRPKTSKRWPSATPPAPWRDSGCPTTSRVSRWPATTPTSSTPNGAMADTPWTIC